MRSALAAALLSLVFALLAHRMRAVTPAGAVAGAILAFAVSVTAGLEAFAVVAAVFVLAAVTTRLGQARKRAWGLAEQKQGRSVWQILANVSAATLCAGLSFAISARRELLLAAMVAALGEAAADTASSECGQAQAGRVYLIIDFRRVPVGTDGGMSVVGTVAALVAAMLIALVGSWVGLLPTEHIPAVAGAAFLGTVVDSLLGATLQKRGWLNNNGVNLVSTVAGAAFAMLLLPW